jgi:hypothetical protein
LFVVSVSFRVALFERVVYILSYFTSTTGTTAHCARRYQPKTSRSLGIF